MDEIKERSPVLNQAVDKAEETGQRTDLPAFAAASEATILSARESPSDRQTPSVSAVLEEHRHSFEHSLDYLLTHADSLRRRRTRKIRADRILARYVVLSAALSSVGSVELYRVALWGINSLSNKRLRLAERIANELEIKSSTSAALGVVIRGLRGFIIGIFLIVFLAVMILSWLSITADNPDGSKDVLSTVVLFSR
jgi:hypothetical protein